MSRCALHPKYEGRGKPFSKRDGCTCADVFAEAQLAKPRTAEEMIAAKKPATTPNTSTPMPSEEALVQLRVMLKHNDEGGQPRMSIEDAIVLLRSYGWQGRSKAALYGVCRRIGRASFARAK